MKNIEILDEFLANVTTQITQCNFDKAKDLCVRIFYFMFMSFSYLFY